MPYDDKSEGGRLAGGKTLTVVLGGGRGSRLYPLTVLRAKPAVPLAGKYRLIDIPISNAINSGLREIFVLTQFNSASLNAHVNKTYRFDAFSAGFVEILAAEQTDQSAHWYQGTADAVRQHLHRLARPGVDNVMILSGDHLYRMDYRRLIERHEQSNADITVSSIALQRDQCEGFGVLAADENGMLKAFREKPPPTEDLTDLELPADLRSRWRMGEKRHLASMGVYVFKLSVLNRILADTSLIDFGHDILPNAIHTHRVAAHLFHGYWADIGTIQSFYEANIRLCDESPPFRFYTPQAPIYTRARFLPPSILREAHIDHTIIADGCLVLGARLRQSVIGLRSRIAPGSIVEDSVVMGNDHYETREMRAEVIAAGQIPMGIGPNCSVKRAIIDKNARIGEGAIIHGAVDRPDEDHGEWAVRDGIVIVRKGGVIPPGAVL
jgi:glucose-1-phosphate adenylyltransferase